MPRALSPVNCSRQSQSPSPSPSLFLSSTSERTTIHPYRLVPSPSSGKSPYPSPAPSPAFSVRGQAIAKRPGPPRRTHSFCATDHGTSFALASTSSAGHLSPDKTALVAPPLERTLSSIGIRVDSWKAGDRFEECDTEVSVQEGEITPKKGRLYPTRVLQEREQNHYYSPMSSPPALVHSIPTIRVHASTTPPSRPSLYTLRTPSTSSVASSRSSSYTIHTPTTPHGVLSGSMDQVEEIAVDIDNDHPLEISLDDTPRKGKKANVGTMDGVDGVDGVAGKVDKLVISST